MAPIVRHWGAVSVPGESQCTTSRSLAEHGCVQEFCNLAHGEMPMRRLEPLPWAENTGEQVCPQCDHVIEIWRVDRVALMG